MILIGQFDSPFVRRVGVALRLYGRAFEHLPWSTFGDADRLSARNPLLRVPTLVLDDGTELVDSHLILSHIDREIGAENALWPGAEADRRAALRVIGLAAGVSDKAIALFYEKVLHETPSQPWVERCTAQITGTLAVLEAERAARAAPFLFGAAPTHAHIMLGTMLTHLGEAHPGLAGMAALPALARHGAAMQDVPEFRETYQVFIPPA